jgi:hypothetical protein
LNLAAKKNLTTLKEVLHDYRALPDAKLWPW